MSRLTLTARQGLTRTAPRLQRRRGARRRRGGSQRAVPDRPPTGTVRLTATVAMLTLAGVLIVAALVDVALAGQARALAGLPVPRASRPARTWRWRSSRTTRARSWACSGCC